MKMLSLLPFGRVQALLAAVSRLILALAERQVIHVAPIIRCLCLCAGTVGHSPSARLSFVVNFCTTLTAASRAASIAARLPAAVKCCVGCAASFRRTRLDARLCCSVSSSVRGDWARGGRLLCTAAAVLAPLRLHAHRGANTDMLKAAERERRSAAPTRCGPGPAM